VIARLGVGDVFGEMSLLSNVPASVSVRTATRCYLLQMAREVVGEILVTHPQVLEYIGALADSRKNALPLL
jgi:CRP-like cAMP-binding protein